MQKTNRLQNEASPYLLQHQHNPVDWYAWGEEAFERARREEKPIFLSIGYSTCYWCHVMEKDSFEHQRVADALNSAFISIKVDREERPDVDHLYMDAIIGLTGHGGWPMSVFLTPEGEPFYGGTYFPQAQFLHLLSQIAHGWTHNREEVRKSAREIARFLRDMSVAERGAVSQGLSQGTIFQGPGASPLLPESHLIALEERFSDLFDEEWGGFGRAPKFPPAAQIRLLLRLNQRAGGESKARQMAVLTLEKMACGGLFDHLGGGFHRYSTDGEWLVPHFEKMLYDNALLIPAYLEAWQVTKSPLFRSVAEESANYLLAEMRDKEGGFYSAQDAGDVGREGEYYVWREDELRSLLSEEEFHAVQRTYGTTSGGNFEHQTNILHLLTPADWEKRETPLLKSARTTLLDTRNKRKHPHRDEKILTGWNGLAITALARAAQTLSNERYLSAAKECARFIRKELFREGKLLRRYCQGEARIGAMLEDYAALIGGLLALYECDFEPEWFLWAEELQRAQDEIFWDDAEQSYYFAPEDSLLLLRQKELSDGAIPSANSLSALNLFKLYHLTGKSAYQERALQVLAGGLGAARRHPTAFSTLFMAFDLALGPTTELAVIAGEGEGFTPLQALRTHFLPHLTVAGSRTPTTTPPLLAERVALGGETTFYLCHDHRCLAPTTDAAQLEKHFNLPRSTT